MSNPQEAAPVVVDAIAVGESAEEVFYDDEGNKISKKAFKKLQAKKEKEAKKQERAAKEAAERAAKEANEVDYSAGKYGKKPMNQSHERTGRERTLVGDISGDFAGKTVLIRARVQHSRPTGKYTAANAGAKMCFFMLRHQYATIQALLTVDKENVSKKMLKYAVSIPNESIVLVEAEVVKAPEPIRSCTVQDAELHILSLFVESEAAPQLPFSIEDASRPDTEFEREDAQFSRVNLDTHQHISADLKYAGTALASRAQNFGRVNLDKALLEQILAEQLADARLNAEDGLASDRLTYTKINDTIVQTRVQVVNRQHPFEPFKFLPKTLRLEYPEAIAMLRESGYEIGDTDDLSTEAERRLGRLVKEKYNTDFFMLDKFPLAVRPFYTMPDPHRPGYSNSYDFFMRGEEIMSGAQRVHDAEFLKQRASEHGVDPATIEPYINAFKYGAPPHAGGGIGLERVLMLYLALGNIRKSSMFPRDPKRLEP
ncbi:hypothetical protein THASP1DRAFT_27315 [Thamnocephalis sphaerospora]|uniref:aspartate--tRNA ligase n=1 Tax=Thamnocephalis sphaerospora TaxID=78915 RepID=A0A4P9XXV0_9FUNG|nr:hypothetical protein THASP1DRAFT_27315 [Thamnocephalis sphaerospora]|eukprot:RKP10892.1 hypothetical protein THASP1DRAFT_27315 [Thamnocephalis sphaerospora]